MIKIPAPFIQMGFWCDERTPSVLMADIVENLAAQGATLAGQATLREAPARHGFAWSDYDRHCEQVPVSSAADVRRLAERSDAWLSRVYLRGDDAGALPGAMMALLQVLPDDTAQIVCNPVGLCVSGAELDGAGRHRRGATCRRIREQILNTFVGLVEGVAPLYAGVTGESDLPDPVALALGDLDGVPDPWYVSERFVGPDRLAEIQRLARPVYCERLANGLYVAWTNFLDQRCPKRSMVRVARAIVDVLGSAAREKGYR